MKNTLSVIFIISVLFLAGCQQGTISQPGAQSAEKTTIVTTLYPLYEFSKALGGDKVEVTLLLPPGAEAHTFEPKPSDIIKINNADIFIYIGAGMEPWAHDIVEGSNNKELTLLDASTKVTLLKSDEHGEHSHEHEGEHAFEWAGVFELEAGKYIWSFAKVEGKYANPAMKMVILETEDSDAHGIEHVEVKAEQIMESSNIGKKNSGSTLVPREIAYQLNFDENLEVSSFTINIQKKGYYAFFTEHMPTEFESEEHFLKDYDGNDIEPIMTEPESEAGHHHGEYDPHFWLDFNNDMKVVDAIAETFSLKDPANKDYYLANAKNYKQKLVELDNNYRQGLNSCKQKEFITGGHNAYAYLAKSYDISYLSAFGISPDSEPTPKAIKEIADLTREHVIKYVLFEELVSPRMAEAIAEQSGAKTLVLNPGHNLLKEEFEQGVTFISLMEENLKTLKIALECEWINE
jgi:ABC-type Zn uptake system ZnuABC Zn-binding protein ZnuA